MCWDQLWYVVSYIVALSRFKGFKYGQMRPMWGRDDVRGSLYSPVRSSFRPQDSKFMTLQTGDVMTKATMCRQCGLIELTGDVSKLRRLTGDLSPLPPLEAVRG